MSTADEGFTEVTPEFALKVFDAVFPENAPERAKRLERDIKAYKAGFNFGLRAAKRSKELAIEFDPDFARTVLLRDALDTPVIDSIDYLLDALVHGGAYEYDDVCHVATVRRWLALGSAETITP